MTSNHSRVSCISLKSRAVRLACLTFAAVALLSVGPRPSSTQSAPLTFATLFYEYRHRDADRAVEILSTWTERQIERDAKLPPDENDAWSKAALALLLVEALRGAPQATAKAEALIADAYDSARASNDQRLLTFCRNWYIVGLTSHVKLSMDVEAELGRRFNEDPLAQLELGKIAERFLEVILHPDRDGYGGGYRHDEIHGMSSHGPYGEDAARAEHALRRALALDPTLVEARVRLGHVLWFLDRRDEADRELTQAAREATSTRAPTLLYLARFVPWTARRGTGKARRRSRNVRGGHSRIPVRTSRPFGPRPIPRGDGS